jgi:hypothetical protein
MKRVLSCAVVALLGFGVSSAVGAEDYREQVRVQVGGAGHPGMDPGMSVCAGGHLHIKGTVENLAGVTLGPVKVAAKAFDADGKLLGTATASTRQAELQPGEKADIDLEFPTVTGAQIQQVETHEVSVVEAPPRR